jgi:hypothetical protein
MTVRRGHFRATIGFRDAQVSDIGTHGQGQRQGGNRAEKPHAAHQSAHHDGQITSSRGLIQDADDGKALPDMERRMQGWMGKVVVTGMILCSLTACGRAPNPDATLRRAYDWYVETIKSTQNPWQRARTDLKSIVTERFLTSIENSRPDLDGTGVTDGRNFDARLAINNVNVNGGTATARVTVSGRMIGRQMLNVYLLKENRTWKIDDVKLIESQGL